MSTASRFSRRARATGVVCALGLFSAWVAHGHQCSVELVPKLPAIRFSSHYGIPKQLRILDDVLEAIRDLNGSEENVGLAPYHFEFLLRLYGPKLAAMGIAVDEHLVERVYTTRRLLQMQYQLQNFLFEYRRRLAGLPDYAPGSRRILDRIVRGWMRARAERSAERAAALPAGWQYHLDTRDAWGQVSRLIRKQIHNDRLPPMFRQFLQEFWDGGLALAVGSGALNLIPFLNGLAQLPASP